MFKWLKTSGVEPLAVSMAGIKLADRLLIVGCSDLKLIVGLATKVGLTGRTCAVDDDEARSNEAGSVATREGALIETATSRGSLPFPDDSFDVVVVREGPGSSIADASRMQEVRRVLRPGGRCVAVAGGARSGVGSLIGGRQAAPAADTVTWAFKAADFVAVRTLAEREGMLFVEGVKKNV
jgi:ubiquinone/menaquinone biosynthesis C-methylase UbiE